MILLAAENLTLYRPPAPPLFRGLSFKVESGELLQVLGGNGSGKSTLLSLCVGKLKPSTGRIKRGIRKEQLGYVPQLQNLESHLALTLGEVVYALANYSPTREEVFSLGLLRPEHLHLSWNTSSGGERQRALLTSALLNRPQLLCLDEPLNHLDGETREALRRAIQQFLEADQERSVILVSHLATAFKGKFHTRTLTLERNA